MDRKPIIESVKFREIVATHGERAIEGTLTLSHFIKFPCATLDHADAATLYQMEREAQRRVARAIDDQVFGSARLALLRLRDALELNAELERLFNETMEELK